MIRGKVVSGLKIAESVTDQTTHNCRSHSPGPMRLAGTATRSFGTDEMFRIVFALRSTWRYEVFAFWHSKEFCLILFFRSAYHVDADHFISINNDEERKTDDIVEIVTEGDGYFMLRCQRQLDPWLIVRVRARATDHACLCACLCA